MAVMRNALHLVQVSHPRERIPNLELIDVNRKGWADYLALAFTVADSLRRPRQ